ncbi:MAG: integrase, partial [Clostridium sp.]
ENLEIKDCNISDTNFFNFLSVVSESNKGSMGRTLRALKYLSAFLKENGIAELKADLSMLTLKTAPVKLIPAYSQEEISKIISVIDFETLIGIRDNAILLLAFETGLRGIDIRNLKFTDIDWNKGEVSVIQSKTKEPIKLPLNGKVMNAVADYILMLAQFQIIHRFFLQRKDQQNLFQTLRD